MEEEFLPEEILVLILTFLSVKSLIRFTCVSKRFRSIILSDPKFARSQLKAASDLKTLTSRLLLPTTIGNEFDSLDLDTSLLFGDSESSSSSSSVRKLPFSSFLLDSINGIVFVAFDCRIFYMWNPCIGFLRRLPDLPWPYNYPELVYGVGYLPATDDYILFIYTIHLNHDENTAALFSTRNNTWKRLQDCPMTHKVGPLGIFFEEALHWMDEDNISTGIVAFDLGGNEEGKFREMSTPYGNEEDECITCFNRLGVSPGGCLSLVGFLNYDEHDCIDVWVLREYNVSDSWNKILNLKLPDGPERTFHWWYTQNLVMKTIMVAKLSSDDRAWVIKINHIEEGQKDMLESDKWLDVIQYEETLIRIDD